jgi:glycosyltransferase involved in cell wall biosynthesis
VGYFQSINMKKKFMIVCAFAHSLINFRGRLLEQIMQNGHSVLALAPDFDDSVLDWCKERGIQTANIQINNQSIGMLGDLRSIRQIRTTIKKYKPEVIMGYTHKPAIYTAIAGYRTGTAYTAMMVTGLGLGFEVDTAKKRMINRVITVLFKVACSVSDHVIFHNRDNLEFFLQRKIISTQTPATVVNGSGVDLSLFEKHLFVEAKSHEITFLIVARIVRYKGILEFALAAAALKKQYPKARFVLAGYRDESSSSYSDSEWQTISDSVDYIGKSDKVGELMRLCHVYVLPSYGEGLPRTVLEAMATGRAVVTTNTPGCRQTVLEGQTGLLVEPRNWQVLRDAMKKFLDGSESWREMGENAYEFALSQFDVEQVNKKMVEILRLGPFQP